MNKLGIYPLLQQDDPATLSINIGKSLSLYQFENGKLEGGIIRPKFSGRSELPALQANPRRKATVGTILPSTSPHRHSTAKARTQMAHISMALFPPPRTYRLLKPHPRTPVRHRLSHHRTHTQHPSEKLATRLCVSFGRHLGSLRRRKCCSIEDSGTPARELEEFLLQ